MAYLIWNNPDGSCWATHLGNLGKIAAQRGVTPSVVMDGLVFDLKFTHTLLKDVTPVQVADNEIEDPGTLGREAWGWGAKIDMPRARAARMNQIRQDRDRRLQSTDVDMLRALEDGNQPEINRMKAQRTVLRSIPQTTDLSGIQTPQELMDFEPNWP